MQQRSHIEIEGWGARHYDLTMDLLLVGSYQAFIERAVQLMDIHKGDAGPSWLRKLRDSSVPSKLCETSRGGEAGVRNEQ